MLSSYYLADGAVQVEQEPVAGQSGYLLECAWLFKKMRGARHDGELLDARAAHLGKCLLVQPDDLVILAANYKQRGRCDRPQSRTREVRPAASRNHGAHWFYPLGKLCSCHQCCAPACTGPEVADLKLPCVVAL